MNLDTAAQIKPTLVVEFLGPDDYAGKVMHRACDFMAAGVQLLWLIDLCDRCVIVHRSGGPPYVVDPDEELSGEDVLPGFRCLARDFFPEEEPRDGGSIYAAQREPCQPSEPRTK